LHALEELLRSGWLCEGNLAEESQAVDEYTFPREVIREVVYQEAGVTRQRIMQRRVSALRQEKTEDDPGEEAHPPCPALVDRHALAEARNGEGRRVMAGAVRRGIRGMHHAVAKDSSGVTRRHAGTDEISPLAAWERSAGGHAAPAFPRSPPGRRGRAVFETH